MSSLLLCDPSLSNTFSGPVEKPTKLSAHNPSFLWKDTPQLAMLSGANRIRNEKPMACHLYNVPVVEEEQQLGRKIFQPERARPLHALELAETIRIAEVVMAHHKLLSEVDEADVEVVEAGLEVVRVLLTCSIKTSGLISSAISRRTCSYRSSTLCLVRRDVRSMRKP